MTYEEANNIRCKLSKYDEYDKIVKLFNSCKLGLRHNNGGIAYTFDDEIKEIVCEIFRNKKDEVLKEIKEL